MSLAPEFRDRLNDQSPQPHLQDVLVVMGSHSLDDSDSDDSDEDEPRELLVQRRGRRNYSFYNTNTSTHSLWIYMCLINFTAKHLEKKFVQRRNNGKQLDGWMRLRGSIFRPF